MVEELHILEDVPDGVVGLDLVIDLVFGFIVEEDCDCEWWHIF